MAKPSSAVILPSLRKPILTRRMQRRPRASDVLLLLAGDSHHHRRAGLFCKQRRHDDEHRTRPLAAESAAVYSLTMTTSSGLMPTHRATAPIVRIVLCVEQCM
jgi:hypothetical protein